MKNYSFLLVMLLAFILARCTRDMEIEMTSECMETEPITYVNQIKPIIDTKCSYSGCHDVAGSAPGNYTQYSGMIPVFDGLFELRVINLRTMPDPGVVTEAQLLTEDQLLLLTCWANEGFLEQ